MAFRLPSLPVGEAFLNHLSCYWILDCLILLRTVYNLVQGQIKKLEGLSAEVGVEAIEDFSEEAPLLTGARQHSLNN